ncbi:phosphate ABC transporter permease PstA [Pelovirga terrestris]|uniref:Phosphate transport system permease protein PstA n=1 Tax=Pelovirga terrestris TaxID=2771352 RepID=A0A8J6URJ8_9BACT|nr:phosphate ABC transporter permease PstA [Pelovirga terrestris]MBD1401491.1 phosphate ABC transporter permease PstA [Pelovirga terrestris]
MDNKATNNNNSKATTRLWRRQGTGTSVASLGQPMVWLAGGMLALCSVMIIALILLVVVRGMATFWPGAIASYHTVDGQIVTGEVTRSSTYEPRPELIDTLPPEAQERARQLLAANDGLAERVLVRTGNYELDNSHFAWVSNYTIERMEKPEWFVVMERLTWGRFYGVPTAFYVDGELVADTPADVWREFERHHGDIRKRWQQRRTLESKAIGRINHQQESARLELRGAEIAAQQARLNHGVRSEQYLQAQAVFERQQQRFNQVEAEFERRYADIREEIVALNQENERYQIRLMTVNGQEKSMGMAEVVRAYPANQLSLLGRIGVYLDRWQEFLLDDPREANSEGGVFPAIFGTVVMTLIMVVFVVPFGVLAALYLREYAKAGPLVSVIRIAVNNLAGVPSIVYGVFGLGFFCYLVGGSIDQLFFSEKLPNPTFGTGGILWASLTLALLTLPVVIVATEEALAAVPGSMREGSYASGASKWQTIQRIVLPRAMPGIMTGMILAMARGAGEVAPLMLVGAVKLAPELPIDSIAPFVHLERSFMHLGFHIYDLGFQSQNSEAAIPMVFTTTLLLILIITLLNVGAIWLRNRLRRKFVVSAV